MNLDFLACYFNKFIKVLCFILEVLRLVGNQSRIACYITITAVKIFYTECKILFSEIFMSLTHLLLIKNFSLRSR